MLSKIFSSALIMLFLAGCNILPGQTKEPQANMTNPAATFCEEQGGRTEIRQDATGGQYGVCIFQDGSECDEWAFFRGECHPGQSAIVPSPAPSLAYVNERYGFSFNPPADTSWALEEQANLLKFRQSNYILWVQFYRPDEATIQVHSPDPTLERQASQPASLLGQNLPKWLVLDRGKVKQVEYAPYIRIADSLRLSIWLGYDESMPIDRDAFEIPEEIIAQADEIIASFALTSGESPSIGFGEP